MIPGMNPRQMQQMMRQMGMSQENVDAVEVIIKDSEGKIYKFENPDVQKISMRGTTTFQVAGEYVIEEEQVKVEVSDEDIEMVSEQAGVSKEEARKALDENGGDIAQAIVDLSNN